MDLRGEARELRGDLIRMRRAMHAIAEVGLHLPRTQEAVLAGLAGLPIEVRLGTSLTSVVGVLRKAAADGTGRSECSGSPASPGSSGSPGGPARAVLLRADMDALPVTEATGLDFAAAPGTMHACGHDMHAAMLVGAARLLSAHRDQLPGDVVFMFQPGEEGFDGALRMLDEGVLTASGPLVESAFALHVLSAMVPAGVVATRAGTMLSAVDRLRVTVRGAGGHGSAPHRARDPIPAAAEMVTALSSMVTRRFDVFDPVVVTVGSFHSGTQDNVIPEEASFAATVRSFSSQARARVGELAAALCQQIARAHGLSAEVEWQDLYPVTVNGDAQARYVSATAARLFGSGRSIQLPVPLTGSDDFGRVLTAVPGALAFLGACPAGADPECAPFNHSDQAVFDEEVLCDGAALYAALALDWLADPAAAVR